MTTASLYKDQLLHHFRHPHNRGGLEGASHIRRGSNPRCGDELEIGLFYNGQAIEQVRFTGRGCSVCIASASMMTVAVEGLEQAQMQQLCLTLKAWFEDKSGAIPPALPEVLLPLAAVREHSARRRCVLLCWEALEAALASRS